jgi:hypothetical protein
MSYFARPILWTFCLAGAAIATPSAQPPQREGRTVAPAPRPVGGKLLFEDGGDAKRTGRGKRYVRVAGVVGAVGTDWDVLEAAGLRVGAWIDPSYGCIAFHAEGGGEILCFFPVGPGQKRGHRIVDMDIIHDPAPPPLGPRTAVRPGDRVVIRGTWANDPGSAIVYDCELLAHRPGP